MVVPQSDFPNERLSRAKLYKDEFLRTVFGVAAASAERVSYESDTTRTIFDCTSERENIVGLGFGVKITEGRPIPDQDAVRVYVREKLSLSRLTGAETIPSCVNGLPTDIVPLGDLVAASRPQPCGVSIGHHAITAGTLGCLVRKDGDKDGYYILSNNHVLADCDRAKIGDLILEPGPDDGGKLDDPIAKLTDFEPIIKGKKGKSVTYDAAIARLLDSDSVTRDIKGIGNVQLPIKQPFNNQPVLKSGRTTNLTEGRIVGLYEAFRFGTASDESGMKGNSQSTV